jgi:hypothetical protein
VPAPEIKLCASSFDELNLIPRRNGETLAPKAAEDAANRKNCFDMDEETRSRILSNPLIEPTLTNRFC